MSETISVRIRFTAETARGTLDDALYYSLEDYANLTEEDKEAAKQARADAFVANIDNAPPPEEPTVEALKEAEAGLIQYLADLSVKIVEKGGKLADVKAAIDDAVAVSDVAAVEDIILDVKP